MTAKTRLQLASIFENGDIPTASGFQDIFDSFVNLIDTATEPQTVQSGLTVRGAFTCSGGIEDYGGSFFYAGATFQALSDFDAGFNNKFIQASASATGSAQGSAYEISAQHVNISGGTTAQGIKTKTASTGKEYNIYNYTTNNVLLYPTTGAAFNSGSVNAAITVSASTALTVYYFNATQGMVKR